MNTLQKLPKNIQILFENIHTPIEKEIIQKGFSCQKRPTTFRVNTLKSSHREIEKFLKNYPIFFHKIPYLTDGYEGENACEKDLWNTDIFQEGKIYLQGISSQFVGEILKPYLKPGMKILDIAAAPGGKTSHISALLQNTGEIVACEMNAIRFEKLNFTIKRQGCTNVRSIKIDAKKIKNLFSNGYFDIIVADLPCSASGRINFHTEKSYGYFEKGCIDEKNAQIQKDILIQVISLLKPGGMLLYSTCTLSPLENEGIIDFLLSHYSCSTIDIHSFFQHSEIQMYQKKALTQFEKNIYHSGVSNAIRILPNDFMEGFFYSLLTIT